ncbi:SH3 domain-containing protein [Streptomyces mirabilis]|uniref:hypothetical protein n=1 Tax=Streptomyces mirabilis TaxID=68239 RepID=UPI0036CACE42
MGAVVAVIVSVALTGSVPASAETQRPVYVEQAVKAGLTHAQAAQLQQKVDGYVSGNPAARQISANKLKIPGGSLTLPAPGQKKARDLASSAAAPACASGHLCILDGRGYFYDYYECGLEYPFDGIGDGTFNNNQTWFTKAYFLNSDHSTRWTNTAKDSGTASWTPVFYIIACDS